MDKLHYLNCQLKEEGDGDEGDYRDNGGYDENDDGELSFDY